MVEIGELSILSGRILVRSLEMGMDYGDSSFARLKSAIVFNSDVGMQKGRREDIKEDPPCGHDKSRAAHGGIIDGTTFRVKFRYASPDNEGALRTYGRYQRKRIIEESLLNEPSPFFLISQAKRAAYEFIPSRKTTTWRELRRHKRDVQKIRPIFLRWLLEDLEKEGRISIKDFPTGTYLVYKPSSVGKGCRGPL